MYAVNHFLRREEESHHVVVYTLTSGARPSCLLNMYFRPGCAQTPAPCIVAGEFIPFGLLRGTMLPRGEKTNTEMPN